MKPETHRFNVVTEPVPNIITRVRISGEPRDVKEGKKRGIARLSDVPRQRAAAARCQAMIYVTPVFILRRELKR